nr:ABC transporter substrate-binding protein [Chloroflexota bacterium]
PPASPAASPAAQAAPAAVAKVAEVKIGGTHPLSGTSAFDGTGNSHGAELAAEEINAAGGIRGLGGARISYLAGDTQSRVDAGTAEAERLIREGASALIGYQSDVMIAVTQVGERERTPVIVNLAVTDAITERGFKYTFRVGGSSKQASRATLEYLRDLAASKNVEVKRVGIIHNDALFATTLGGLMEADARALGYEVAGKVQYPVASTDLTNEAQRLRGLNADVLLASSFFADGLLLARTLSQLRVDFKGVWGALNGAFSQPRLVSEIGPAAEFISDNNWAVNTKSAEGRAFGEAVQRRWNEPVSFNHVYGYLCMRVAADALERAGSTDKEAVRNALAQTNLDPRGIVPWSGPIRFDETGQNINVRPSLVQVLQSQLQVVWPRDAAVAEPVFPVPSWSQR